MDNLQGSHGVDAKSAESRRRQNAATRTERQPNSKGSQRTYFGAPDNSSNKNTAKNTDGTASDAHFGFSGRGAGGVAPFTTTNRSLAKKNSLGLHKTERPGKPKRRNGFGDRRDSYPEEDQDVISTGAPASNGAKTGPGSAQKSASYLNMTSSFRNKVEGPPPLGGRNNIRSHANLHGAAKLSGFSEQNQRAVGQGGRQPTQKKKSAHQAPATEGAYVSFGQGKDGRGRRAKNGSVSFDNVDPEESLGVSNAGTHQPGVFDRLSRGASSDPHCHAKHPDNWKWRPDAPGAPIRDRKRSTSNSAEPAATIAEQSENDYDDNFTIKVIPTG